MFRTLAILATVGALSCHRPAPAEGPDPTTGASEPASLALLDGEPLSLVAATSAVPSSPTTHEPTQSARRAGKLTSEPPTISLCCDEFAGGLCFRAAADQCQAQTSKPRECPEASVREIHDRDGRSAWLCAEPD